MTHLPALTSLLPAPAVTVWGTLYFLLALLFGFMCVFLILLILIQKGRGGGLSSAFGGGGGGNTAFGTKTGDLLTWVTSAAFALFLLLSMGLVWVGDAVAARQTAVVPPAQGPSDTFDGGQTEPAERVPGPPAPAVPEPGARPEDDGVGQPLSVE